MSGAAVGGTQASVPAPALLSHFLCALLGTQVCYIPKGWSDTKLRWKVLHGSSALGAFVLTVQGLLAVSLSLF